jgi:hypothetical protein
MGRELRRAKAQPLQPALAKDGEVKLYAGAISHRFRDGAPLGVVRRCGRAVIVRVDGGVPVKRTAWQDDGATVVLPLPTDVRSLWPDEDPVDLLVVDTGEDTELVRLKIREHGPEVLGPRIIDEFIPASADAPASVVRHIVKGFGLDGFTSERVAELEEVVCSEPFATDPLQELAEDEGWVGWKTRREILGNPDPWDYAMAERMRDTVFKGQRDDGSWDGLLLPTAYGILNALALGIPGDDSRVAKAADWLLSLSQPDNRPGMWMLRPEQIEQWNRTVREDPKADGFDFLQKSKSAGEVAFVRREKQQRVWPTCGRHYDGLCDSITHGSATAAYALCRSGRHDDARVRDYANTILQMEGMFGYFCACWGPNEFGSKPKDGRGGEPDFNQRPKNYEIARNAVPYRYARDAQDAKVLARMPHYPDVHRPDLADTNGWCPHVWRVMEVDNHYALEGAYWQNADCWAKTNRALSQYPGWPGSISEFSGLFQCHLYQTDLGRWEQGFPAAMLSQAAELCRLSRERDGLDAPAARFAKGIVLRTVPWLRRDQKSDGTWHHGDLDCHRGNKRHPVPGPRLTTYLVASALKDFGILERLRP